MAKKKIDAKKTILRQIKAINVLRETNIEYLTHWVFNVNIEVENPMKQDAFTNQVRERMRELRAYNFQIQSLNKLLEKGE